jgi:hypothetical protein
MSNYHKHALIEFKAAKWLDENGNYCDEMQEAICKHILKLLDVFGEEGHSGTTAPYTINLFSKLAGFEPIVPITGEDWEWIDHGHCLQNKRCSHVFKQPDRFNGQAYDIDGKIFWEWYRSSEDVKIHKSHFTGSESCVPITFPYTPKREYVFVPTDEFPNESLLGPSHMVD